jgi:hypothetical protein
LLPSEKKPYAIARLQTMRANILLINRAEWQRAQLGRLERVEEVANRMGWGRDAIRAAFGHRFIPATVNVVTLPRVLFDLYDATAVLDLPDRGNPVDPATVRAALGEYFVEEPEPRPGWLVPQERWPPPSALPAPE